MTEYSNITDIVFLNSYGKEKDEFKILLNINKREIKPFIPSVCQICANHQSHKEYNSQEIADRLLTEKIMKSKKSLKE